MAKASDVVKVAASQIMNKYIIEHNDINRVAKLEKLTNAETFWADVRRLVKNVTSDHSIKRWQILAETRYNELTGKKAII